MPDALDFGVDLIDDMIEAAFLTMGQNGTAARILVHGDIAAQVTARFMPRPWSATRPSRTPARDR